MGSLANPAVAAATTGQFTPIKSSSASTISTSTSSSPKRIGQCIRLRPSHATEYIKIHGEVWPGVLERITKSNIHDYSIFYDPIGGLLFASFKYTGNDYEGDMKEIAEDEETKKWWKVTDGMQESLNEGATGSEGGNWWREMGEVFYHP
jgi:L-rhamnose mutarotase